MADQWSGITQDIRGETLVYFNVYFDTIDSRVLEGQGDGTLSINYLLSIWNPLLILFPGMKRVTVSALERMVL